MTLSAIGLDRKAAIFQSKPFLSKLDRVVYFSLKFGFLFAELRIFCLYYWDHMRFKEKRN